ncbi:unnamed protein product [Arabidopsis thaliana]|uniref:Very-long-chain (3R)-3-hydroxyacyl-CoA dehydratase n=1 Tax=Arabidopsis thaliana TaxID=3702 RepID=A0A654GCZ6_ARATH|nr:unnamed protein product [Arabidopsis thaliana]
MATQSCYVTRNLKSAVKNAIQTKQPPTTTRAAVDPDSLTVDVAVCEVLSLQLQFSPSFCMVHQICVVVLRRAISLLIILNSFLSNKTIISAYASAGFLISLFQTAAILEVLHGAIGIVPSGFLSPLMQWSGRTHFILAIVGQIKEVQDSPWLSITLVAWCIGEMIRYPHYAFTCLGRCPYWLTYLRYTGFIVIYPTGLVGELLIMYKALPYVKERNLYANFFSVFPFSYYDFLWAVLLVYPFLWLKLYLQLFKQRKSKLGKSKKLHGKRKRM